jgi:hypothetical protein
VEAGRQRAAMDAAVAEIDRLTGDAPDVAAV